MYGYYRKTKNIELSTIFGGVLHQESAEKSRNRKRKCQPDFDNRCKPGNARLPINALLDSIGVRTYYPWCYGIQGISRSGRFHPLRWFTRKNGTNGTCSRWSNILAWCKQATCKRQELHAPGKRPGRRMHVRTYFILLAISTLIGTYLVCCFVQG